GRDALAQGLADDVDPALGFEFDEDAGDVGLYGSPGQEHAAGNVRRRVAPGDQGGDLDLSRGERLPAGGRAPSAPAPDAPLDAVGAEPSLGPPDIPPGLHVLVQADGLVQGGP